MSEFIKQNLITIILCVKTTMPRWVRPGKILWQTIYSLAYSDEEFERDCRAGRPPVWYTNFKHPVLAALYRREIISQQEQKEIYSYWHTAIYIILNYTCNFNEFLSVPVLRLEFWQYLEASNLRGVGALIKYGSAIPKELFDKLKKKFRCIRNRSGRYKLDSHYYFLDGDTSLSEYRSDLVKLKNDSCHNIVLTAEINVGLYVFFQETYMGIYNDEEFERDCRAGRPKPTYYLNIQCGQYDKEYSHGAFVSIIKFGGSNFIDICVGEKLWKYYIHQGLLKKVLIRRPPMPHCIYQYLLSRYNRGTFEPGAGRHFKSYYIDGSVLHGGYHYPEILLLATLY